MKKHLLLFFAITLVFSTSCGKSESNITIKVGVVMQSGDVKAVARQEFLITKSDIVALLENSKNVYIVDSESLEQEIKNEIDYEKNLSNSQKEVKKYRNILAQKTSPEATAVKNITVKLKENLIVSDEVDTSKSTHFLGYVNKLKKGGISLKEINKMVDMCDWYYKLQINTWKDFESIQKTWKKQYEDFKGIVKLVNELNNDIKAVRNNLFKMNQEIIKLDKDVKSRVSEKMIQQKDMFIDSFQQKVRENLVSSIKTNLSGEATFVLSKGKYYLFGIASIGISKIIWSLPITLDENEEYFELSNDNAYSLSDEGLYKELIEAFLGLDISQ